MSSEREPDRTPASFTLRRNVGPGVTALAVAVASFLGALIVFRATKVDELVMLATLILPLLLGVFAGAWARPVRVTVGEDGVLLERPFNRRFLAIDEIEGVSFTRTSFTLSLRAGERIVVSASNLSVVDAISEALAARDRRRADRLERLARRDRSAREWSADLARVLHREGGFREEAVSAEAVGAVLDDVTQPLEQRLGAAVALSRAGLAERVRVAAEASANPRVRVALRRIAGGEEDSEAELEALVAQERRS